MIIGTNKYRIHSAVATLLAMVYLFAASPIHLHGADDHYHTDVEHSDATHTTDDCHNFIYHGQLSKDCQKHHHATEFELECLICHHFVAGQKLVQLSSVPADLELPNEVLLPDHSHIIYTYQGFTNPLRGPPAIA